MRDFGGFQEGRIAQLACINSDADWANLGKGVNHEFFAERWNISDSTDCAKIWVFHLLREALAGDPVSTGVFPIFFPDDAVFLHEFPGRFVPRIENQNKLSVLK